MKMDLVRPCKNCPFRNDIEPYIRAARVRELERGLVGEQATFSCHKTVDYDRDDEDEPADEDRAYTPSESDQQCAGAMILLMKIGAPNQLMRIYARFGGLDLDKLDMQAPVYDTFDEMYRAHRKAEK